MERLQGKNVLITGASSGIGQAIAVRFAAEGANIAINYRSGAEQAEATRAMAKAARSNGSGRALVVQADVSNEDQVRQMFATTIEEFGQLDILVNNAGHSETVSQPRNRKLRFRSRHFGESPRPIPVLERGHPALPFASWWRGDLEQFQRARNHTRSRNTCATPSARAAWRT